MLTLDQIEELADPPLPLPHWPARRELYKRPAAKISQRSSVDDAVKSGDEPHSAAWPNPVFFEKPPCVDTWIAVFMLRPFFD
jgi:hypothetical protein